MFLKTLRVYANSVAILCYNIFDCFILLSTLFEEEKINCVFYYI